MDSAKPVIRVTWKLRKKASSVWTACFHLTHPSIAQRSVALQAPDALYAQYILTPKPLAEKHLAARLSSHASLTPAERSSLSLMLETVDTCGGCGDASSGGCTSPSSSVLSRPAPKFPCGETRRQPLAEPPPPPDAPPPPYAPPPPSFAEPPPPPHAYASGCRVRAPRVPPRSSLLLGARRGPKPALSRAADGATSPT
uniref:Uncharacterized protein n=1 Tax=Chrysotila carterae TaxID=13221 RepID=A0A7S4BHE1_CHRCT